MAFVGAQQALVISRHAHMSVINCRLGTQRLTKLQASAGRKMLARGTKIAEAEIDNEMKSGKKEKRMKEEDEFEDDSGLTPQQVEAFLSVLCDETDIAEVQLKMGGFKMKVRRSISAAAAPAFAPVSPAPIPISASPASEYASAASAASATFTESDDESENESHVPVTANKVGIFRRGRYVKGKQVGKGPVVEEGASVKKGQTLAFIEQMGTYWPLESPQAGEIARFVLDDGEPVEYGQTILELAPFFGGHIIGDSKYA